jgi:hypothetical protein
LFPTNLIFSLSITGLGYTFNAFKSSEKLSAERAVEHPSLKRGSASNSSNKTEVDSCFVAPHQSVKIVL